MKQDRRQFLATTTGVIAAAALPGWVRSGRVRSLVADEAEGQPRTMDDALALARQHGRLLLVIVLPANEQERWRRARLFGVYVNRVTGEPAAELAMCDLWCATEPEWKRIAADVPLDRELLAGIVEPENGTVHPIRSSLLRDPRKDPMSCSDDDDAELRTITDRSKAAVEQVGLLLHEAIAPDAATLASRVAAERTALAAQGNAAILETLTERTVPTAVHARFAPAWLLQRARSVEAGKRESLHGLAVAELARRWQTIPPPRTRWASSKGCGTQVQYQETDPEAQRVGLSVACGMAYVPEYSQRFLVFYLSND
jgi:hypothetical protein